MLQYKHPVAVLIVWQVHWPVSKVEFQIKLYPRLQLQVLELVELTVPRP
jgi:hypothetical protein